MKTLLLLRHAKSDWSDATLDDFDRPLNKRGRRAAPLVGSLLRVRGLLPDLVLCSTARRALETWELAAARLDRPPPLKTLKSLYLAAPSRILSALATLPEETEVALVVGHNPGLETLARRLAGPGSNARALRELEAKYPTAALAVFSLDLQTWRRVAEAPARLLEFIRPRDLEP